MASDPRNDPYGHARSRKESRGENQHEKYLPSSRPSNMSDYVPGSNGYNPPPPPPYPPTTPASGAKPIADAVNQAFDHSTAVNELPADVIAQITEEVRSRVIDSLRNRKELSGTAAQNPGTTSQPAQQSHHQPYPSETSRGVDIPMPAAPQTHSFGPGHSFSSGPDPHTPLHTGQLYGSSPSKSSRTIHTPPTPDRDFEDSSFYGQTEMQERRSTHGASKDFVSSIPTTMPILETSQRTTSPIHSGVKEDLSARYGERIRDDLNFTGSERPVPSRARTNDDETVVEKMWQPLFEANGKPTARANQFLRGIALHLVEESEPKNSLVIGPFKMKRYFEAMKSSEDVLPWKEIFMLPSAQLSSLYSSLSCQHHLIPRSATPYESPHLAALTPQGFASFMSLLIQAYPEAEYQRLSATVRDWPISNADERKERWPKELSRRLLPKHSFDQDQKLLHNALRAAGVSLSPSQSWQPGYPPPPPGNPGLSAPISQSYSSSAPSSGFMPPPPPSSVPPSQNQSTRQSSRRKGNYAGPNGSTRDHHDTTIDHSSDESSAPSAPIERERKPYVAKEGAGKVYEDPLDRVKSASAAPLEQPSLQTNTRDRSSTQQSSTMPQYVQSPTSKATGQSRRERGSSFSQDQYSTRDTTSHYERSSRPRTPPYGQPGYGRGSGEQVDGILASSSSYYEDDRYRERDRLDRGTSRDGDQRERDRRYAKYDEEYRRNAGLSNTYAGGNPPLGTGERRY